MYIFVSANKDVF